MRAPAPLRPAPETRRVAGPPARFAQRRLGWLLGPLLAVAVGVSALPVDPAGAASRQEPAGDSPASWSASRLVTPATEAGQAPAGSVDAAGSPTGKRPLSRKATRAPLPAVDDAWTGYAFDACRAPSRRVMDRWRVTSPFLGVGVYIGGALRACPQRHLTRSWVRHQVGNGWKLLPIWVGPQASCTSYRKRIPSRPGARDRYPAARDLGAREARKARAAAERLGLRHGSTIWYDLEWFPRAHTDCRKAALSFLSRWTEQLHATGYRSGVYSSVSAGIAVLGNARGNPAYTKPDRVWFAWSNGRHDVSWRKYLDAPRWKQDRRVHQYALDVVARYGGQRMAIDRNFVDLGSSRDLRRTHAACGRAADRPHYRPVRARDRGPHVEALQCLLRARGHLRGEPSGSYDAPTREAVRSMQRMGGLPGTGRVTERTWTALLAAGPRTVLKRGSEGPAVRRLQRALTAALPGVVDVHGHFGPRTTSAVARYQERTGMRVTGVATPAMWQALRSGEVVKPRPEAEKPKRGKHGAKRGDRSGKKHGKNPGKDRKDRDKGKKKGAAGKHANDHAKDKKHAKHKHGKHKHKHGKGRR